jgi:hypothetical protein
VWLHQGVKRRIVDVGIFPNIAAVLRLVEMLLAESDEDIGGSGLEPSSRQTRIT